MSDQQSVNHQRFTVIFLLLFFLAFWSKGQLPVNEKEYADSLENALRLGKSDSAKARTSLSLAQYWSNKSDLEKGKAYLGKGRQLGKSYPYIQAISYFFESDLYLGTDTLRSRKAILKGNSLLSAYTSKEAYVFRSKLWYNSAILQQQADHISSVVDILLNKVIPLTKKSMDSAMLAKYYSQTGLIFMNSRQHRKAETYFKLAIQLSKHIPAKSSILVSTYILAASNYVYLLELPEAKKFLDKAKIILRPPKKSIKLADYYFTEGNYYEENKEYQLALDSYNKGIAMARELKKRYLVQTLLLQKYSALKQLKQYRAAKQLIDSLSQEKEFMASANNRKEIYNELAKTNHILGNEKEAYTWLRRHSLLSDSLYESQLNKDIHELELKFRNAENSKSIAVLKAANEKVNLEAKNSRLLSWLLGALTLFLLFILIAGYFFYRNTRKLVAQKELNHQQEIKYVQQQHQISITQAMLQGQEEERSRVARDLHDGLGGMLAVVKMNLSGYAVDHPVAKDTGISSIIDQLDNSINELRHISRNMMPASLVKFGIETALNDLCESFLSEQLQVDFQCFGISNNLVIQEQITIYRIVQELLSNVVRHAQATSVLLQCSQNSGVFFITVEDNGKGFNPAESPEKHGMGLHNIKTRVDYLNGKMEILSSETEEGTNINIEIHVTA
ncbi:tetratricopeptide repeat-containing sensor histidine kinase [Pedobacter sp. AW31-3R]|uniref:tetratricopeptide repeat-containing sensor histidine kinase n=1 Tax=Pedobacter sp. AW31-3R TaxID=3445781 RepID=UPI003FA045B3